MNSYYYYGKEIKVKLKQNDIDLAAQRVRVKSG